MVISSAPGWGVSLKCTSPYYQSTYKFEHIMDFQQLKLQSTAHSIHKDPLFINYYNRAQIQMGGPNFLLEQYPFLAMQYSF